MEPSNEARAVLHRALEMLAPIADQSGSVLYSGLDTLRPGRLYLMGLNPGGPPEPKDAIWRSITPTTMNWNAYLHESWGGNSEQPRPTPLQIAVRDLFKAIDERLEDTFTTNAVFVRSESAKKLDGAWPVWVKYCWPVHQLFLQVVRPRAVLCLGFGQGSAFELVQKPEWSPDRRTKATPRVWPDHAIETHGLARVARNVALDLGQRLALTCTVVGLHHPSWDFRRDWTRGEGKDTAEFLRSLLA